MDLKQYFKSHKGVGVLSTADGSGNVNSAVFARPHVFDDGSVGFIMANHRSLDYVRSNGGAAYLFHEDEGDKPFQGMRLKLEKLAEVQDDELLSKIRRRHYGDDRDGGTLVTFTVQESRPLVGG